MLAVPDHRPAEGCAITLSALHGAAAAAGTTIVAVVAVTKVSSERAERVVCVYYCRTGFRSEKVSSAVCFLQQSDCVAEKMKTIDFILDGKFHNGVLPKPHITIK